uniref:AlNc14C174G8092 protein n=1 Tax=Albugo laibachii Nc14 TaxID=890382 RepID=F0WNT3_9STRA|nr:AlNc14C174G8092 [Albugo laibachii Nc14]|eukprot:CCA22975.1 AlNc14C174G8092 [Albugo laibachii Nc14]
MKTENPSIDESERKNADAVVQTSRSLDADAEQTPGKAFAETQAPMIDTIHLQHKELIQSGIQVSQDIFQLRTQLNNQLESEQYLSINSVWIKSLCMKTASIRQNLEGMAGDLSMLEDVLSLRLEENIAIKNAAFASQQQEELERFEQELLHEKEKRRLQVLDDERRVLDQVFQNDLKTYQAVKDYLGVSCPSGRKQESGSHTLEDVDLVVTGDASQLESFYGSSESETE